MSASWRRLLVAVIACLSCAAPSLAAIAVGTGVTVTNTGAVTSTVGTLTVNAGDTVVVSVTFTDATSTVSSVTDSGGDTFIKANRSAAQAKGAELWYVLSATGSTNVTVNHASNRTVVLVERYTGVVAIGVNTVANGASNTAVSIAITTQDANNWVAYAVSNNAANTAGTVTTGTRRRSGGFGGGATTTGQLGDNTSVSSGTSTAYGVSAQASTSWDAVALELRSTSGAAPTCVPTLTLFGVSAC